MIEGKNAKERPGSFDVTDCTTVDASASMDFMGCSACILVSSASTLPSRSTGFSTGAAEESAGGDWTWPLSFARSV